MREILFRGKCINSDEWVEGSLLEKYDVDAGSVSSYYIVERCDFAISIDYNTRFVDTKPIEVIPETVGQFTGLYDKYGKRIFEGDIINCYTFSKVRDYRNSVVRWNEVFLCFKTGRNSLYGGHAADIYEVIGNIHDNPELLEELNNENHS